MTLIEFIQYRRILQYLLCDVIAIVFTVDHEDIDGVQYWKSCVF